MKTAIRTSAILLLAAAAAFPAAGCRKRQRMAPIGPGRLAAPAEVSPAVQASQALARAQLLEAQGLDDVALAEFERAIAINPTLTPAYVGMADIHRKQGNLAEAEAGYNRAAQLEPGNFRAQYGHGLMLQLLGRLAESVRAYLRALAIAPNDFDANLNLATAYLQLREGSAGLPYAQRAVRLNGANGAARVNLGAIYAALGDPERAVTEYQQAAELMDLTPELLLNLADSLGQIGRYAEMQNVLEQLVRQRASAPAYERLATALFRQQKYDESLENFRKALELDGNYYPALNGVGVSLLNRYLAGERQDQASHREGVEALRRSLRIEPRQPAVVDLLARYG
ncbi:MAG: tetratricopeptide repeat protein [Phycisphaerales bacterium]